MSSYTVRVEIDIVLVPRSKDKEIVSYLLHQAEQLKGVAVKPETGNDTKLNQATLPAD